MLEIPLDLRWGYILINPSWVENIVSLNCTEYTWLYKIMVHCRVWAGSSWDHVADWELWLLTPTCHQPGKTQNSKVQLLLNAYHCCTVIKPTSCKNHPKSGSVYSVHREGRERATGILWIKARECCLTHPTWHRTIPTRINASCAEVKTNWPNTVSLTP
jgi:hypothetical protein